MLVEAADPDDAAVPNATGPYWNFSRSNSWTITFDGPDGSDTPVLACVAENAGGIPDVAVRAVSAPNDLRAYAKVSLRAAYSLMGIAFRVALFISKKG
jgi:hypothetical protein